LIAITIKKIAYQHTMLNINALEKIKWLAPAHLGSSKAEKRRGLNS
jgi:hypothetical protein